MSDETQLDKSLQDESGKPATFVDKQWLYVNDSNNNNYTGQIVIDTTTLSNSGSYIGWSESYLAVPLVLQAETTSATALNAASKFDFGMAMKSGYWQLIHSMSVEFNNGSVVQQTPFLNVFSSFKNLTSWSEGDLKCWGKATGFCPDTADAWLYNNAVSAASNANARQGSGQGFCNNRLAMTFAPSGLLSDVEYPTAVSMGTTYVEATVNAAVLSTQIVLATEVSGLSDSIQGCANVGLLQRMKWLNFDLVVGVANGGGAGSTNNPTIAAGSTTTAISNANKANLLLNGRSGFGQIFKNYISSTNTTSRAIIFLAVIRLKDICDFFDKMPLMKGATMRLYINTNQCSVPLSVTAGQVLVNGTVTAFPSLNLVSTPTILGGGQTCPIMVSSADFGQGMNSIAPVKAAAPGATVPLTVALSVVQTQFPGLTVYTAPIRSVRLYAPAYTMSPQAEASYLSMSPTKKIVYEDLFQYQFNNIGTAGFNFLVSNGLPNLKSIVIMSFIPAAGNGVATATAEYVSTPVNSLLSPFASSGGTPDPISLTNLNIQISGKNLFNDNIQYDYQEFLHQFVSSNQLNGSLTTGLASGLIGESEWSDLYRYYYADCSRGLPQEAGVSRSIQISGTNNSLVSVNLMIFASFTRSITIDVRSGVRIE